MLLFLTLIVNSANVLLLFTVLTHAAPSQTPSRKPGTPSRASTGTGTGTGSSQESSPSLIDSEESAPLRVIHLSSTESLPPIHFSSTSNFAGSGSDYSPTGSSTARSDSSTSYSSTSRSSSGSGYGTFVVGRNYQYTDPAPVAQREPANWRKRLQWLRAILRFKKRAQPGGNARENGRERSSGRH